MLKSGEQFADVGDGITLCYETFGRKTDPALLLIAGLGSPMIWWDDALCRMLAGCGLYVIRFDNRDAGKSAATVGPSSISPFEFAAHYFLGAPVLHSYGLGDMARDAVELLDALHIDRAHVVGASMGGMIAQEIAIRHPERVLTLTSIMSTTGCPSLPLPSPEVLRSFGGSVPTDRDGFVQWYVDNQRMLRASGFPEEVVRDIEYAYAVYDRGSPVGGTSRQLRAVLASGSRKQRLPVVEAPTLVIHGDVDPLVSVAAGHDTAASIPFARLSVIRGMGHSVPRALYGLVVGLIEERVYGERFDEEDAA